MRLETYKMAMSILLKFQTLKCDISRTIWRIEVSNGSLFCIFHALSFELNLFFDRTCSLNFWSSRSLGRKPLGFDVQTNSDHKTQKIKLCSVRALERYLNEKNLIHGRVMATISKFSPQIFETYFNKQLKHRKVCIVRL